MIHERTANTWRGPLGRWRPRLDEENPWKPYPGAERRVLPSAKSAGSEPLALLMRREVGSDGSLRAPTAPALDADGLARLLFHANGVTGRVRSRLLRAAPSAGALYANEVYVVALRVGGLEPGVYYYSVADHGLVRLRRGSFRAELEQALEDPGTVRDAAAAVLVTGFFRRYTHRYRNRGYRYALIDCGHIGENLRLAARAGGIAEATALRFRDDALAALLGIDGREEAVCAVHALAGRPAPGSPKRLAEKQHADPAGLEGWNLVIDRYHEATKLVASAAASPVPAPLPPAAPARGAALLALPAAGAPPLGVLEAIRRRRSAPGFADRPVAPEELAFVLECAGGAERPSGVACHWIVHRVEGVPSGHYAERAGGLARLRAGDLRDELTAVCLGQDKAGDAAAVAIVTARFAASDPPLGARRYRDQLIESGAIAQRVYLAAEALGLAARNLAAFRDDELNALLGLDPAREGAIHLTVFGQAP